MTEAEDGLSSQEALSRLCFQLEECLESVAGRRSWLSWLAEAWLPSSARSLFRLTSLLFLLLAGLALLSKAASPPELASAVVILVLSAANLALSGWESYQRSVELERRAARLVEELREAAGRAGGWRAGRYPHPHTPPSPTITLQLARRDGETVNVPWALLVAGDTVLLRPGQSIPALCRPLLASQTDPAPLRPHLLEETPYLAELEAVLTRGADRPLSVLVRQRHFLVSSLLECMVCPLVVVVVLAWACVRHLYIPSPWLPATPKHELFLTEPVAAALPLLPLLLPAWWILVNTAGLASVLSIFSQASRPAPATTADPFDCDCAGEPGELGRSGGAGLGWPAGRLAARILRGTGEFLCRTENLLHCLGSVTSHCCTDKQGILAWPNASPEKIFFLKEKEKKDRLDGDGDVAEQEEQESGTVVPEILTVTQDLSNQVQFDDPAWRNHLPSLAPLGLSVNLNTCHPATAANYAEFQQFLAGAAGGLGGAGRVCLCQLSSRIGSVVGANWELEDQLCSYRHPNPSSPGPDPALPSPHAVSVLARERGQVGGRLALFTQGTADLVLDYCGDCWSGRDLHPLDPATRKACREFYQRASLTSTCTAFSYRPGRSSNTSSWPKTGYLQLPARRPGCVPVPDWDSLSLQSDNGGAVAGPASCLDNDQTFLGMVQLQHQAMVDMVQFIDLLEAACIRFVHFSKENELRSRVFSEKMGLESGWNCHISLESRTSAARAAAGLYGGCCGRVPPLATASLPALLLPWQDAQTRPLLRSALPGLESLSSSTSSIVDTNNRAQLPAGIENIRPHLEKMDNVPLLVSLFTDCTPASTREMVEILQQNGEVVALMGSSAAPHNMRTFLTADVSLAVEPLYPQVCQAAPSPHLNSRLPGLAPAQLASHMVAVGCSVSFQRAEEVSVYQSILLSRRHVLAIRRGLQFWVCSCLLLSLTVVTCLLLLLPSPLSPAQVLVLTCLHLPLLTTASFFSHHDSDISAISTGKRDTAVRASRALMYHALWCYGLRFLPALLTSVVLHLLAVVLELSGAEHPNLSLLSDTAMAGLALNLAIISTSFLSRTEQVWRYRPSRVWPALAAGLVSSLAQCGYLLFRWCQHSSQSRPPVWLPTAHLAILPVLLAINEFVKRREIKVNVRYQKRARLDFNTKLGINSPF